jgi:hypothetical protein
MIELIVLIAVCGGIVAVARRRGARGWPFVVAALAGWLVVSVVGVALVGSGPDILLRWGWLGLCYLAVFVLTGGGRRLESSWQCPECQFFNEPTTLVCPCGYRYPADE